MRERERERRRQARAGATGVEVWGGNGQFLVALTKQIGSRPEERKSGRPLKHTHFNFRLGQLALNIVSKSPIIVHPNTPDRLLERTQMKWGSYLSLTTLNRKLLVGVADRGGQSCH